MAPKSFDRRDNDRRRGAGRTYSGPERRTGRDRRRTDGRRGYDRNGDERDNHYYGSQKKQQNPMIYLGVAGGVILLIIIIAVASSGGSQNKSRRRGSTNSRMSDQEVIAKEKTAQRLVMQGGSAMESARLAYNESGVSAAYPHYKEAYGCFENAHGIYEELNTVFPDSRFYGALKDVESNLSEALKMMGTGS